jgi:protein-tyrosine phosphatase
MAGARSVRHWVLQTAGTLLLCVHAQTAPAFNDRGVQVLRSPDSGYLLQWSEPGPVDVLVSARPDAKPASMRLLARHDAGSKLQIRIPDIPRPYFALRAEDGSIYRTAQRLLPLQQGSNFRDLGGYPAAGGKHVRWGLLYRSASMPKLTDADYDYLSGLSIKTIVDLRSVDERQLSPTDWRARLKAKYVAVDYPGEVVFDRLRGYNGPGREQVTELLYEKLPILLRQQYKTMFHELLTHDVPVVIQCSAGQDRAGIAAGLILSALGTPRQVIYKDYLLSTEDRTPANEMSDVNLEEYAATNSEARFLIAYRNYAEHAQGADGSAPTSPPLRDAKGRPLLQDAFDQIEAEYGSVTNYLLRELDVDATDIAKLRSLYLD